MVLRLQYAIDNEEGYTEHLVIILKYHMKEFWLFKCTSLIESNYLNST